MRWSTFNYVNKRKKQELAKSNGVDDGYLKPCEPTGDKINWSGGGFSCMACPNAFNTRL